MGKDEVRILAIDPGITTGYALYNGPQYDFVSWQGKDDEYDVFNYLRNFDPDVIVCESFLFRQAKTKVELFPVQLIGVVNLYGRISNSKIVLQTPAQAKGFVQDRHLKKLNYWNNKFTNHPNDAARHLVYYLVSVLKDSNILEAFR